MEYKFLSNNDLRKKLEKVATEWIKNGLIKADGFQPMLFIESLHKDGYSLDNVTMSNLEIYNYFNDQFFG